MACPLEGNDWAFDYALLEDLPPLDPSCFHVNPHDALSVEFEDSFGHPDCTEKHGSKKRLRTGSSGQSDSKAYKEKLRREKLNDRFQELSSVLEPGKPPITDKAVILSDVVRMVVQLREEAQKLKESHDDFQGKVNELKTEKNELRDEKLMLKAEKEKLEQQVRALSAGPRFLPHLAPMPSPFAAPPHVVGSKLVPYLGFPGAAMWQLMPPHAVDTSKDHTLRPPVA